ncbi:hypothetical protein GCM10009579_32210 [Streptomyces javensis]|uniref:Secreted protein n=1 Tax=Streptomyces javensis TaxID=114698 RepID=A0ABP4HQE1_9ACTN
MIRGLAATAAGAAVVGAYLMRRWDRSAGRRVAEAASETARQEMKYEERIAELEADAEKASELRGALNTRLRAKRAELARLRNEHAELLRRYATAETERASALEGRRRLALEAASPAKALEAAGSVGSVASTGSTGSVDSDDEPDEIPTGLPSAAAYAKADEALSRLRESARRQKERREQAAAAAAKAEAEAAEQDPERDAERDDRKGPRESRGKDGAATLGKPPAAGGQDGDGPQEPRAHARTAASAVVPYAAARRAASRSESGFDYFGTQKKQSKKQKREPEPAAEEDLADVIGDETLAETRKGAVGEVIDLTAHDETEQIDLGELRSAIS